MKYDIDTKVFLKNLYINPLTNLIIFINLLLFAAINYIKRKINKFSKIYLSRIIKRNRVRRSGRGKYINNILLNYSINEINISNQKWFNNLPSLGSDINEKRELFNDSWTIKLASKEMEIDNSEKINWQKLYVDPENTMAMHRFGWLLQLTVENQDIQLYRKGLEWIINWWDTMQDSKTNIAWESYSVSERITNWIIFLCTIKKYINDDQLNKDLIFSILSHHLNYLVLNLEFKGDQTNNHIINNARALYIGGRILEIPFYELIGSKLLQNETDLILPDGCLNEGSVHYQFLITRTFFEIYYFSKISNDKTMTKWIRKRLKKMVNICHFFCLINNKNYNFPLIGDISPDFPPLWFAGYPFYFDANQSIKTSPWLRLWNKDFLIFNDIISGDKIQSNKTYQITVRNPWVKFQNGPFTIYTCIDKGFNVSHSHQDEGSFCLFYKNYPIIIDLGSCNYLKNDILNVNQNRATSHNTVCINKIGLNPSKHSLINIQKFKSSVKYKEINNGFRLSMIGFRQTGRYIYWDRDIIIIKNDIIVKDKISSLKNEKVHLYYYFDSNCLLNKIDDYWLASVNNVQFSINFNIFSINKNVSISNNIKMNRAISSNFYGDKNSCNSLNNSFKVNGEILIESRFSLNV